MLTVAGLAAVVAGAPAEIVGDVMRVRVLRSMFVRGQLVEPGDVIEVDELVAGRLIGMGKAAPAGRETAAAAPVAERAVDPATSEIPKSPRKATGKSTQK